MVLPLFMTCGQRLSRFPQIYGVLIEKSFKRGNFLNYKTLKPIGEFFSGH